MDEYEVAEEETKILKEMQTHRNYEVEQINRTYSNTSKVDNWLKPQETSLKNEKFQKNNNPKQNTTWWVIQTFFNFVIHCFILRFLCIQRLHHLLFQQHLFVSKQLD